MTCNVLGGLIDPLISRSFDAKHEPGNEMPWEYAGLLLSRDSNVLGTLFPQHLILRSRRQTYWSTGRLILPRSPELTALPASI
jgi:hypothetical protein